MPIKKRFYVNDHSSKTTCLKYIFGAQNVFFDALVLSFFFDLALIIFFSFIGF